MKYYEGKEVCQGCNKPGAERSRDSKDSLCNNCKETFRKGSFMERDTAKEYTGFFQHYHAYYDESVNSFCHSLLAAINNQYAGATIIGDSLKSASGSNGVRYKIPKSLHPFLIEFFNSLEKRIYELNKQERLLPEKTKAELAKQKNEIFNEGVIKGRSLLHQLNNGEISMAEFEKSIGKY